VKNQKLIVLVLLVVIVGLVSFFFLKKGPLPYTIINGELTAKNAYNIALPEAKKFSSDSFLVNLSTVNVQSNGESKTWFVTFYSPAKGTNFKVSVTEGKITATDDANKKKTQAVSDNWIDSNEVAKIAIPKCGEVTENNFFFDLDTKWTVNCKVGENKTLYIDIDPKTGEYQRTRKAGIGW
jgi:hypothetical protein